MGTFLVMHNRARATTRAVTPPTGTAVPSAAEPAEDTVARRRMLLTGGLVVVGGVGAGAAGRLLAGAGGVEAARRAVGPVTATGPAGTPPVTGADFVADGTPSWLTSAADFYRIDTALQVPQIAVSDYRLRIHGMVERELTFSYEALRRRPLTEVPITMTCVSNEVGGQLISNARFTGVPLRELLLEAGLRPGAQQLASTSVDGWTSGTPVAPILEPDRPALLALGMNGAALPVEHGFPVRMVVAGLYGYVSGCKWITDIEVTTFAAFSSYWQRRGWAQQAPIKTESRIDTPRPGAALPSGPITVAGVAWAQHKGITGVEVRTNTGPWRPAQLAAQPSTDSWRMWRATINLPPGEHSLQVRATDATGYQQTEHTAPILPNGATGWHTVAVTAA